MFNPTDDCKAPVNIPQTSGPDIIIPGGKYYGLCPCDQTVCPVGYDYTFPNFSAISSNPIDDPSANPINNSIALNSLSNKISSYDYRCDVTCEIFRDYTIGVIVWNEMFADRKQLKLVKNQTFVHQTTSGTWKFTTVN